MVLVPDIAFVVPLHRPHDEAFQVVAIMASQARVFAVDDGSGPAFFEICQKIGALPNVTLLKLRQNHGIAGALNAGIKAASMAGANGFITVDQDTRLPGNYAQTMTLAAAEIERQGRLAVLGPSRYGHGDGNPRHATNFDQTFEPFVTLIQSGLFVSRRVIELIGTFDELLVIDGVDHEYCLRAAQMGCEVLGIRGLEIGHVLGIGARNYRYLRIGGHQATATFHSADRRYYINRNTIHLAWRFRMTQPRWAKQQVGALVAANAASLALEPDRLSKFRAIVQGVLHGLCGRTGPRPGPANGDPATDRNGD